MLKCSCQRNGLFCIIPPYMLETMATSPDQKVRKLAVDAIETSADARATRRVMREMPRHGRDGRSGRQEEPVGLRRSAQGYVGIAGQIGS